MVLLDKWRMYCNFYVSADRSQIGDALLSRCFYLPSVGIGHRRGVSSRWDRQRQFSRQIVIISMLSPLHWTKFDFLQYSCTRGPTSPQSKGDICCLNIPSPMDVALWHLCLAPLQPFSGICLKWAINRTKHFVPALFVSSEPGRLRINTNSSNG